MVVSDDGLVSLTPENVETRLDACSCLWEAALNTDQAKDRTLSEAQSLLIPHQGLITRKGHPRNVFDTFFEIAKRLDY